MTVGELISTLQQIPDKSIPATVIAEYDGIWGTCDITKVKVVHDHEESESWYESDDTYPRAEIT